MDNVSQTISELCLGGYCINTVTLDYWLRIVTTASTLTIGIAASILAYQQFKLSRARLKFDLYEKRLALFNRVRDFASAVALAGRDEKDITDPGKFYRDTVEHRFLFEPDVWAYFAEVYER